MGRCYFTIFVRVVSLGWYVATRGTRRGCCCHGRGCVVSGLLSGPDGQWSLPHSHRPGGGSSARSIFSRSPPSLSRFF